MRGVLLILPILVGSASTTGAAQGTEQEPPETSRDVLRKAGKHIDAARRASRFSRRFKVTLSTRPRVLIPGERGTLYVMVRLSRGMVVVPERDRSNVKLSYRLGDMPLSVTGLPKVTPPTSSGLPDFAGKKLYDDLIVYEIPVAALSQASSGKYMLKGAMTLGLHGISPKKDLGITTREFEHVIRIGAPPQRPTSSAGGDRLQDARSHPSAVRPGPDALQESRPKPEAERPRDLSGGAVPSDTPPGGALQAPNRVGPSPRAGEPPADSADEVRAFDNGVLLWILGGLCCGFLLLLGLKRLG